MDEAWTCPGCGSEHQVGAVGQLVVQGGSGEPAFLDTWEWPMETPVKVPLGEIIPLGRHP